MARKRKPKLGRASAMKARPVHLPVIRTEERDGKRYVTVDFMRPRWQQLLGASRKCSKTFGLDVYGQEVYDACDGRSNVKKIAKGFASSHHVSVAEAELSVTTFLKTLVSKGLVGMEVREETLR